jgi:hypothetical protein
MPDLNSKTYAFVTILSYYTLTHCSQKIKPMRKDRQFTYHFNGQGMENAHGVRLILTKMNSMHKY